MSMYNAKHRKEKGRGASCVSCLVDAIRFFFLC